MLGRIEPEFPGIRKPFHISRSKSCRETIWKVENQNKNALKIAGEGAKLSDKFVGYLEDFEKTGKTFETGQNHYTSAMGKLKDGPGNVCRKMELLRELGAAPNRGIKAELIET